MKHELCVLEILKKRKVYIYYLFCLYNWYLYHGFDNYIIKTLESYNNGLDINRRLTKKELIKLVNWLES